MKTTLFAAAGLAAISTALLLSSTANAEEPIPRDLIVDLTRQQFSVICGSETFTSCMAFTTEECKDLSEQAIKQCLAPLPEKINPEDLDNASLESCPQTVFADAGYAEEQAKLCFDEAAAAESDTPE